MLEEVPYWENALPQDKQEAFINRLTEEALTHRQELKIAVQTLAQSRLQLRASKLNRIPDPEIGGDFSISAYNPTFDRVTFYGIMLNLSVPLPVYNNQQGEIAKSKAEIISNESQIQAARFLIKMGIQKAILAISSKQRLLENYRQNTRPQSQELLHLVEQAFTKKEVGVSELFFARQSYLETQQQYLDYLEDTWRAWVFLEQETGVPLELLIPQLLMAKNSTSSSWLPLPCVTC